MPKVDEKDIGICGICGRADCAKCLAGLAIGDHRCTCYSCGKLG